MEKEKSVVAVPHKKDKHIFKSLAPAKDLVDCECCGDFFDEEEVSVSEGVVFGVKGFYLLCAKCSSKCKC